MKQAPRKRSLFHSASILAPLRMFLVGLTAFLPVLVLHRSLTGNFFRDRLVSRFRSGLCSFRNQLPLLGCLNRWLRSFLGRHYGLLLYRRFRRSLCDLGNLLGGRRSGFLCYRELRFCLQGLFSLLFQRNLLLSRLLVLCRNLDRLRRMLFCNRFCCNFRYFLHRDCLALRRSLCRRRCCRSFLSGSPTATHRSGRWRWRRWLVGCQELHNLTLGTKLAVQKQHERFLSDLRVLRQLRSDP